MTPSRRWPVEATLIACVLGLAGCTTLTPQAQTAALIARAEAAMGSATLKTLTLTGRGTGASVGQAYAPGMAWPALQLTALSRSLNFETASFREEFIRSRSEPLGRADIATFIQCEICPTARQTRHSRQVINGLDTIEQFIQRVSA